MGDGHESPTREEELEAENRQLRDVLRCMVLVIERGEYATDHEWNECLDMAHAVLPVAKAEG